MTTTKSRVQASLDLYDRAEELIPGKTQLISRRASSFAHPISPIYADHAKGSRFVDVDGNEYIDWVNAVTAIILGHADDVVDGAVKEQIGKGSLFTLNSPLEIELAELLIDTIPSAEMVRYTKGGGESCAVAVRIARGTTGKDKILFSGYHGWHDWYQSANYLVDPVSGEFPFAGIEPTGVPKALAGTAIPFIYEDIDNLRQLFEENKGEVAAVMMEPMRSERPKEGYLEAVKELCHANDALLIFDEVSSGWRISLGSAQEWLGITPDMSVFAKAMSNGYPMGCVVGSREAMEPADRMFISSSYWSDNIGLAASVTTINELKRRNSTECFKEIGDKMSGRSSRRRRFRRHLRPGHRHPHRPDAGVRCAGAVHEEAHRHAVHPGNGQARRLRSDLVQGDTSPHRRGHIDYRRGRRRVDAGHHARA